MSTYHYRVIQLPLNLFQDLVIQIGKDLASKNSRSWRFLLVDGTGFDFKESYELSLHRGDSLRKVRSHVRLAYDSVEVLEKLNELGRKLNTFLTEVFARYKMISGDLEEAVLDMLFPKSLNPENRGYNSQTIKF